MRKMYLIYLLKTNLYSIYTLVTICGMSIFIIWLLFRYSMLFTTVLLHLFEVAHFFYCATSFFLCEFVYETNEKSI